VSLKLPHPPAGIAHQIRNGKLPSSISSAKNQ
jgi:hypothetical protein